MVRSRRIFGIDFKAKVVLEALKEKETIEVLAKKYELHLNQISIWKAEDIRFKPYNCSPKAKYARWFRECNSTPLRRRNKQ